MLKTFAIRKKKFLIVQTSLIQYFQKRAKVNSDLLFNMS